MHYAVHGHTAAELIYERADADKPHMGLTTWAAAPEGKIVKSDVSIAKNYLSEKEMRSLERIVSAYLDLAEDRAERHIPMTMEDWAKRLDLFLMADDREILQNTGKITAEIAKAKAETEPETSDITQVLLPPSPIIDVKEDRSLKKLTECYDKLMKPGKISKLEDNATALIPQGVKEVGKATKTLELNKDFALIAAQLDKVAEDYFGVKEA